MIPEYLLRVFFTNGHNIFVTIFAHICDTGAWFNIKIPSYQYRKSHCGDKMILCPPFLHNRVSHTGKMTFLYWIRALVASLLSTFKMVGLKHHSHKVIKFPLQNPEPPGVMCGDWGHTTTMYLYIPWMPATVLWYPWLNARLMSPVLYEKPGISMKLTINIRHMI